MSGPVASLAPSSALTAFTTAPARAPRWLLPASCALPCAYYIASASSQVGLFEEGTFVAAARSLGVPHPPGAPVASLLDAFAALLPVGPLSFRVAVASAVLTSLMLGLFARALFYSLRGLGLATRGGRAPALLALSAAWFAAQTPLVFSLATRPNVHAAQFALSMFVIDALTRFELSEPGDDRRPLYLAALAQGLAFANHHVFALLLLSVAAPTLGRVFARRGFLGLMSLSAVPILGFSAWLYVPIRGGRDPFINLGEPNKLTRIWWVLNADPWRGPRDAPELDTLATLASGLAELRLVSALVGLLALLGLVLGWRSEGPRRFAMLWAIALVVPLASIAWILEPTVRSDAWGALTPCALAAITLAAAGVGLTLQALVRRSYTFERVLERVGAASALAALLALVTLADARRPDTSSAALEDPTRRTLPTRALLITPAFESWFRWLGAEAEERLRADVTVLPLPGLAYPHTVESLSEQTPTLAPLLGTYTHTGELSAPALSALALQRPVLLELDGSLGAPLYASFVACGWYERWGAGGCGAEPWSTLYRRLRDPSQPELRTLLVRNQLYKAIAALARDQLGPARAHLTLGLVSAPADPRLLDLEGALRGGHELDVRALLQRAARTD